MGLRARSSAASLLSMILREFFPARCFHLVGTRESLIRILRIML